MLPAIICVFIQNVADALFTLHGINSGYMRELNPLMAKLIANDQSLFLWTKVGVGCSFSIACYIYRKTRLAQISAIVAIIVYMAVLINHGIVYINR